MYSTNMPDNEEEVPLSVWESASWAAMPYKRILIQLPDQTTLFVDSQEVAEFAAQLLSCSRGGVSPESHLIEQVIPAILEEPMRLIALTQKLPFEVLRSLAERPCWRTPAILAERWWPAQAAITLCTTDI